MIQVEIKERGSFQVIGKFFPTSLATQQPQDWWKSFKTSLKKNKYLLEQGSYSLQKYPRNYFQNFNPDNPYEYSPAVPWEEGLPIPEDWEKLELGEGLFAVFVHRGTAATFPQTMGKFFQKWLPNSDFELDDRIHFCFMPPSYQLHDPGAKEEIWIPIRPKK